MKLKIGVLGAGHLGKIHLKCIQASAAFELVGFYDPNAENVKNVVETFQIKAFNSAEALLEAVDVIDIVTPTITHFNLAKLAALKNKHIFIEKPLTHTVSEAKKSRTSCIV